MNNPLNLKTGDIVLFSGRCKVGRFIQLVTWCKWSHVGMIIIDDRFDSPLVCESTHNDRVPGLDLGRRTQGVQTVYLKDRLEGYKGNMAIMRLEGHKLSQQDLDRFKEFRSASVGVLFEESFTEAFLSMFKWINNEGDFNTRFCTEHIGGAYQSLGLLTKCYPVHKITPADFAKRKIKLTNGNLSEPFIVKKYRK